MDSQQADILVVVGYDPEIAAPPRHLVIGAIVVAGRRLVLVTGSRSESVKATGHLARAVGRGNDRLIADDSLSPLAEARSAAFPTLFVIADERQVNYDSFETVADAALTALSEQAALLIARERSSDAPI